MPLRVQVKSTIWIDSLKYSLRSTTLYTFLIITTLIASIRFISALNSWHKGNNSEIEAYSFTVIFPAVLIFTLSFMGKTITKEGLLMRFGTMTQLLLIISIPKFSLYLALGFPVVFLVVELFVTRVPKTITTPIERVIVK